MRPFLPAVMALLCLLPLSGHAAELFPARLDVAGHSLSLNGKGVRTRLLFNLYNAGLYLPGRSTHASAVLAAEQPMALRLEITSSLITSAQMEEAVREGFRKSATDSALHPSIERFIEVFREAIKEGDLYDFIYLPTDTIILKNGKQAAIITGADFRRALFGIWLGSDPVQESLKKALLGN